MRSRNANSMKSFKRTGMRSSVYVYMVFFRGFLRMCADKHMCYGSKFVCFVCFSFLICWVEDIEVREAVT